MSLILVRKRRPPQLRQGSTGDFRELATDIISIKTNKEQGQKRSGAVLLLHVGQQ
jgi:hypothetical protein